MGNQAVGALLTQFDTDMLWAGLKWLYVLGFGIYALFAIIVLTQIRQMVSALSGGFDRSLKLLGWVHVLVAVGAFLLAVMVL